MQSSTPLGKAAKATSAKMAAKEARNCRLMSHFGPELVRLCDAQVSSSLNSLKGVMWGIIYGTTTRVTKGDTRSLDNGSSDKRLRVA